MPTAASSSSDNRLRNLLPLRSGKSDKPVNPREAAHSHLMLFEDVIIFYHRFLKMSRAARQVSERIPAQDRDGIVGDLVHLYDALHLMEELKKTTSSMLKGLRPYVPPETSTVAEKRFEVVVKARKEVCKYLGLAYFHEATDSGRVRHNVRTELAKELLRKMNKQIKKTNLVHALDEFVKSLQQIYEQDQGAHVKALDQFCDQHSDVEHYRTSLLSAIHLRPEFVPYQTVGAFRHADNRRNLPPPVPLTGPPRYGGGDDDLPVYTAPVEEEAAERAGAVLPGYPSRSASPASRRGGPAGPGRSTSSVRSSGQA